jgi:hypothetical protein
MEGLIDAIMTLDLTDDEVLSHRGQLSWVGRPPTARALVSLVLGDWALNRNSGQQTTPTAKIISITHKRGPSGAGGGSTRPVPPSHNWGETVSGTLR